MKRLLDEDVAIEVARCLKTTGHEVMLVADELGMRTNDVEVWRYASPTGANLITCNRQDLSEMVRSEPAAGAIILNRRSTRQSERGHLLRLLEGGG